MINIYFQLYNLIWEYFYYLGIGEEMKKMIQWVRSVNLMALASLSLLSACGGGSDIEQLPTAKERIEGTWSGTLIKQNTTCVGGIADSSLSNSKAAIHKLTLVDSSLTLIDDNGQVFKGQLLSDTGFDVGWAMVSAMTVDENTISYRNMQIQNADVVVKRVVGVTGATCTYRWEGKLSKN
jgi:hypothetical protein